MKHINKELYTIENSESIYSPSLMYFYDIIEENAKKIIAASGNVEHLWPHVKTHKMYNMIDLQVKLGITRFKCATIKEAEMVASAGGKNVLIAYPLVGPSIERFIALQKKFPTVIFWAIGDDLDCFKELSDTAVKNSMKIPVLIDTNVGMNRTGVKIGDPLVAMYEAVAALPNIDLHGLHCYDGHVHESSRSERDEIVGAIYKNIQAVKKEIESKNLLIDVIIAGGTPTFPCYVELDKDLYYSPGTAFVNDYSYYSGYEDLNMLPGAVVFARVVSNPTDEYFTLDVGNKAIAADPQGPRGVILEYPEATPVSQSEEHWVFKKTADMPLPKVGTILKVIPMHVCPTSALYPYAKLVKGGKLVENWEVTARNRE